MRKPISHDVRWLVAAILALLVVMWASVYRELNHSASEHLHQSQTRTQLQAQMYAENTRSTIKRLDELLLDLRANWSDDWGQFSRLIQARQAHIGDITFQIGIIDAEGYLAFSNLAPATTRPDLRDREHFRVHKDSSRDRLYISRPLKGRVSGKWSLQFTRPIWRANQFKGVIVVSIAPETLSRLHANFRLSEQGLSSILRDSGEVMAFWPDPQEKIGKTVTWPHSQPDAPVSGSYVRAAQLDGIERVFGYYKLTDYGLNCFVAESLEALMLPHRQYRATLLWSATAATAVLLVFGLLLYRSLHIRARVQWRLSQSKEQQRLLSMAVEQSSISVFITNAQGVIELTNAAFEQMTGYSPQEVIGQTPRILRSGLHAAPFYQAMWNSIRAGKPWKGEMQNRKKNGELYWELCTISPVLDANGAITHFIAFKDDITARKQQEAELRRAKEAAEFANVAVNQFLANISHEVRTPLNGVLGMAQMLQQPTVKDTDRIFYAQTIQDSGTALLALFNDILDLSKAEVGKLQLNNVPFEPLLVLQALETQYGPLARARGLTLTSAWLGSSQQRYATDVPRLRQMLSHLVVNAIKFTQVGRVHLEAREVQRMEQKQTAWLEWSVTDTGIGIAQDVQQMLFKPFSQIDGSSTRQHGGAGLGLAIVRSLAHLMGGQIGLDSQPGQGSRFWFQIPVSLLTPASETQDVVAFTAPAPPAPAKPASTIDVVQVQTILRELFPLLKQKKFSAITKFKTLQTLLAGSAQAQAINTVGEALFEMRFDLVLERLRQMAEEQGWDVEG